MTIIANSVTGEAGGEGIHLYSTALFQIEKLKDKE